MSDTPSLGVEREYPVVYVVFRLGPGQVGAASLDRIFASHFDARLHADSLEASGYVAVVEPYEVQPFDLNRADAERLAWKEALDARS